MSAAARSLPRAGGSRVPLLPELLLAAIGIAVLLLFPDDLAFLTTILITAIFVLSLDLVLGHAGIVTLGHAALFGTGAYAAGLTALHLGADPLLGLLVGGIAGAAVAALSGALLLRTHGLTFLMLTVAVSQLLLEATNKASFITGGDDGLSGFAMGPVLGLFGFDFFGRTGFLYALAVLIVAFGVMRRLVSSPFGLTAMGIRSDAGRMKALGCPVYRHLLVVYTMGGAIAGIAGALSAQTSEVVGLNSLGFTLSAEAVVMLVLGGIGRLWGALVGTAVFMLVHHVAAGADPYTWLLVIGTLLIVTVLFLPRGLIQLVEHGRAVLGGKGRGLG